MYRALRRLEKSELVCHTKQDAPGTGAKRKVYAITDSGRRVLNVYEATTLAYQSRLTDLRQANES